MFPFMVGASHGAKLMSLEHRFYGSSQPFDNWDTKNFSKLTTEQALADVAGFLKIIN